jgi:exopolyphosphatase/guanosine-5'-triphosphate,3'-diphosphate pyrophosphatase
VVSKDQAERPAENGERGLSFPLRVACVDMGSNAIRFVAAEFLSELEYQTLASERRPVRLGHGVFLSGRLNSGAMDAAVEALADFSDRMRELGVGSCRAVATSAVRESRNGQEFVDRILGETGIEIDVISGSEEARLVHLAVASRVPLGSRRWLLVDLGGGSVELSLVDQDGTFWSESHTMGSVRLLEELTESGTDPGRFRRVLEEYISALRIPAAPLADGIAGYVATGGNIEALAKLGAAHTDDGVSRLSVEKLRAVIEQLARMSYRERVDELGLREDRADVVLPAALVYERLARLCSASEITVPHVGIKEGVLIDLVSGLFRRRDHADRQSRSVLAGALTVGRKYLVDEQHARHVADQALVIFDDLRPLHGLDPSDRKILQASALLHDIGQFVSFKAHHKHSLYLISHSELPTFNQSEMRLVANVARYHRKAHPQPHHEAFVELSDSEQDRVMRLSAILRVADSLDREHLQRVRVVKLNVGENEVTVYLEGAAGVLLEGWAHKKKTQLFGKVFGKRLRLRFIDEGERGKAVS